MRTCLVAAAIGVLVGLGVSGGSSALAQEVLVTPYSVSHSCISPVDGAWRWDCQSGDWPVYFVSFFLPSGPVKADMYVSIKDDYDSVVSSAFIRTRLSATYGLDGRLSRHRPYGPGITKTYMFFGWRLWGSSEDQYLPVTMRVNSTLTGEWIVEAEDWIYLPAMPPPPPCTEGCGTNAKG